MHVYVCVSGKPQQDIVLHGANRVNAKRAQTKSHAHSTTLTLTPYGCGAGVDTGPGRGDTDASTRAMLEAGNDVKN